MLLSAALCLFTLAGTEGVLCLKDGRIFEKLPLERRGPDVLIRFEAGELRVPGDLILDCVIPGDAGVIPDTPDAQEKLDRGLVPFDGDWVTPSRRQRELEKRIAKRRDEIEERKKTRLWRNRIREETKNFAFEATVPRHIFEHYRDLMEAYFTAFMKDWKVRPPRDMKRLKVCFYGDRENYLQVTGQSPNVLGYFRFIEPMELNIYYDRLDPIGTEQVMFHEANHYLQKLIDVGFSYPHWPGEALAEYYAGVEWDPRKKKLTFGLVLDGRLAEIKNDIDLDDRKTIRELVTTRMYEDYTWGWSLVHFLMEDPRYAKKFRKFYAALPSDKRIDRKRQWDLETVEGAEMLRAFMKYLGLKTEEDLEALQAEWYHYVEETLQVESLRGLEKAAWRAYNRGRNIKARRLFGEAIEGGTHNPVTFHRYAQLLEEEDEDEAAIEQWQRAIELDPLMPEFHIELGKVLIRKKDTREEGKRRLRLAHEIDRDNLWLEHNLERYLKK